MRPSLLCLTSIALLVTACNGGNSSESISSLIFTNAFDPLSHKSRKFAERISRKEEEEKGSSNAVPSSPEINPGSHHKSSIIWEVSILVALGLLIMFLVAFFAKLNANRRRKDKAILEEFAHESPPIKPVSEEVMIKVEERRSELVFFVEEEEWFKLEDLLEGVADLRTQGFCSSLYVVQLKNDAVYAVKRLKKLKVSFEEFGLTMRRLGKLRHPNVLPLVCYNSTHEEKLLIYTFQRNGSLLNLFEDYVEGKRPFPWKLRLSLAFGIAQGLDFIHKKHDDHNEIIPHGNIKLSNIMLNDNEEPMISEYGYTKFLDPSVACLSAKGYMAPEKTLSEKSDVYSFGVMMLELLTGKIVEKSGLDLPRWVGSIVREEWTGEVFDEEISGGEMYAFALLNVSLKCVAHQPEERPAIAEVLEKIQEIVNAQEDVSHG